MRITTVFVKEIIDRIVWKNLKRKYLDELKDPNPEVLNREVMKVFQKILKREVELEDDI